MSEAARKLLQEVLNLPEDERLELASEIIASVDGPGDAGWEAAKRFAVMATAKGMDVQIALLPDKMDPDDYIAERGGEAFREKVIGNPHAYMSFIMAYAKRSKNLSYENDVLQFIHEVLEELTLRTSPVERDMYIRQLSVETSISVEAINQQFMKMVGKHATQEKSKPNPTSNLKVVTTPNRKVSVTELAERL